MEPTFYSYGIVGFGIAGQLIVLELMKRGISAREICICDEFFLGGALVTQYGTVLSNTPWWKTRKALAEYPAWSAEILEEGDKLYKENDCMPLQDIGRFCLKVAMRSCQGAEKITTKVTDVSLEPENKLWTVTHTFGSFRCKYLCLAQGGTEKQLNLDLPQIPLQIALDKYLLSKQVSAEKDVIAVFGLSHSGTICLQHLQDLGVRAIGVYNTKEPFSFARDGDPNGIKEASEKIADSILAGSFKNLKLVSYNDALELYKSLNKCTKIISCIGFKAREIGCRALTYEPETGSLHVGPNCYGYGIAFPKISEYNGTRYPEVSVLAFQEQIRNTLPCEKI